jgi:hypothetical protein
MSAFLHALEIPDCGSEFDLWAGRRKAREGGSVMAKLSRLLWAVLVFVAKPALAENFTYKQYSASSEGWKRGFVFAVAQHQTTINFNEGPPYPTARAYQRCLSGASDAILEQQVETYVARNPSSLTEPMVVVVIKTLHDLCRSEIEKGR